MPFFSLLIPFRDRELLTLHKCLDSIARQSFQDFELLLLDYGSSAGKSQEVEALYRNYPLTKYFFSNTRGLLWNRADALNTLIALSNGAYLMILDADIFVPTSFLQQAIEELQRLSSPPVLELRCFETLQNGLRIKKRTGRGLYMAQRTHIIETGGYDTFFRVWGVEDDDMIIRITPIGKQNPVFLPDEGLIHIWHAHDYSRMPTGWLQFLTYQYLPAKQLKNNTAHKQSFDNHYPKLLTWRDRPILQKMDNKEDRGKNTLYFQFKTPLMHHYLQFMQLFSILEEGKFMCVEQRFSYYIDEQKSIAKRLTQFFNIILGTLRFSYRFTDIATHDKGYIALLEVRDFLFYFLLNFEAQILDYFFEYDQEKITFWVCKKGA